MTRLSKPADKLFQIFDFLKELNGLENAAFYNYLEKNFHVAYTDDSQIEPITLYMMGVQDVDPQNIIFFKSTKELWTPWPLLIAGSE